MIKRHIIINLLISLIFTQSVGADDFSLNILTYKNSPYYLLRPNLELRENSTTITSHSHLKSVTKELADDLPFILSEENNNRHPGFETNFKKLKCSKFTRMFH